jgi:hypothetical protein
MRDDDPNNKRWVPGTADIPPDKQVEEWPSDSAVWMNRDEPEYEDGPLFPDDDDNIDTTR